MASNGTVQNVSPNPFTIPADFSPTGGVPVTLSWEPTTPGTVTITLFENGDTPNAHNPIIAKSIKNSGSFSWTPAANVALGEACYLEIVSDSDPSSTNYSPDFILNSGSSASNTTGVPTTIEIISTAASQTPLRSQFSKISTKASSSSDISALTTASRSIGVSSTQTTIVSHTSTSPLATDTTPISGTQSSSPASHSNKTNTGAIAGGVVGGVTFCALVGIIAYLVHRLRKRPKYEVPPDVPEPMSQDEKPRLQDLYNVPVDPANSVKALPAKVSFGEHQQGLPELSAERNKQGLPELPGHDLITRDNG